LSFRSSSFAISEFSPLITSARRGIVDGTAFVAAVSFDLIQLTRSSNVAGICARSMKLRKMLSSGVSTPFATVCRTAPANVPAAAVGGAVAASSAGCAGSSHCAFASSWSRVTMSVVRRNVIRATS
jgi:hypothetical protein